MIQIQDSRSVQIMMLVILVIFPEKTTKSRPFRDVDVFCLWGWSKQLYWTINYICVYVYIYISLPNINDAYDVFLFLRDHQQIEGPWLTQMASWKSSHHPMISHRSMDLNGS